MEEPARAGGSTTPSSPNRTKTTRIIDQESPVVDQGSVEEQQRIAAFVHEKTAKIDALIAKTERFIELSKERRAALITAAVTGQCGVRVSA